MTVGGTQAEYVVDIWSGNHPFFLGKSTAIMTNAGRVSKFGDRFGDLGALSEVETIDSEPRKRSRRSERKCTHGDATQPARDIHLPLAATRDTRM